ncbi:unnamed protein product [Owenia fusiformis]|uniref:Uncharacterized protein n=1 Tax=Owenia fusiformis TaxID=6347 RepID=A0A8S4NDB9_OWEFU|nr:unnamed protein product [Owenia fusiformis]
MIVCTWLLYLVISNRQVPRLGIYIPETTATYRTGVLLRLKTIMGNCLGKRGEKGHKRGNEDTTQASQDFGFNPDSNVNLNNVAIRDDSSQISLDLQVSHNASARLQTDQPQSLQPEVDALNLETLAVIRTLVNNDQEPPRAMVLLHKLADTSEAGWLSVVMSLVHVIPIEDPLGPAVVTLLLDECPLPTKVGLEKLLEHLNLSEKLSNQIKDCNHNYLVRHRNICVVLGCLAEKMAGPSSVNLLNEDVLGYLMANLNKSQDLSIILYSLIALEKFAQTSENKITINRKMCASKIHPLEPLEKWRQHKQYAKKEVGFCAQWCLDNLCLMCIMLEVNP